MYVYMDIDINISPLFLTIHTIGLILNLSLKLLTPQPKSTPLNLPISGEQLEGHSPYIPDPLILTLQSLTTRPLILETPSLNSYLYIYIHICIFIYIQMCIHIYICMCIQIYVSDTPTSLNR
jgi:hypothetical protein